MSRRQFEVMYSDKSLRHRYSVLLIRANPPAFKNRLSPVRDDGLLLEMLLGGRECKRMLFFVTSCYDILMYSYLFTLRMIYNAFVFN